MVGLANCPMAATYVETEFADEGAATRFGNKRNILGLSLPGFLRGLRYLDDGDTSGETRESHGADHRSLDRGRALSTV